MGPRLCGRRGDTHSVTGAVAHAHTHMHTLTNTRTRVHTRSCTSPHARAGKRAHAPCRRHTRAHTHRHAHTGAAPPTSSSRSNSQRGDTNRGVWGARPVFRPSSHGAASIPPSTTRYSSTTWGPGQPHPDADRSSSPSALASSGAPGGLSAAAAPRFPRTSGSLCLVSSRGACTGGSSDSAPPDPHSPQQQSDPPYRAWPMRRAFSSTDNDMSKSYSNRCRMSTSSHRYMWTGIVGPPPTGAGAAAGGTAALPPSPARGGTHEGPDG